MKLCTFEYETKLHAGLLRGDKLLAVAEVNSRAGTQLPTELLKLIEADAIDELREASAGVDADLPLSEVRLRLPYPVPPKIWCIGLNYKSHAEDLDETQPEEPGSFMKPTSSLFEPGGVIEMPPADIADDIDAEGELGLVFGKRCRDVPIEVFEDALLGYTVTLDMTALDVLRRNTRYLQRSKSFDTFFSFGPVIVTKDEVQDVTALEVVTNHNGREFSRDYVRNMRHRPDSLVALHTAVMTFEPGAILSTGCPKGARIQPGDRVEGFVDGVGRITANVTRRERQPWSG